MKKMLLLSGAAICAAVLSGCCCCGCGGTTECVEEDVIIATPVQPKGKCKGNKKAPCSTGNCAVPTACNAAASSGKAATACSTCGCEEKKGDKTECSGNTGNLTASNCTGNQDQAPAPAPVPAAD